MPLNDKLRELRKEREMTQEAVAEQLGVSAQTVSKWERGLLSPDILLLPKIALLFRCSIDSIFAMDAAWSADHRREFEKQIHDLHARKDWEGIYDAWIREIELNPDHYMNYADVMLHVLRKELFDNERILQLLSLADHAEKCCTNDAIRNEIYRIMLQICAKSTNEKIKRKAQYYYQKLPMIQHSREIYAGCVLSGEAYDQQIKHNVIYLIDLAECAVRQLIRPEMPAEEKLFHYKKAAALYEAVLNGKYGGFWDVPLLENYRQIAALYTQIGDAENAAVYMQRIFDTVSRHLSESVKQDTSALLHAPSLPNTAPAETSVKKFLRCMLKETLFKPYSREIADLLKGYIDRYPD